MSNGENSGPRCGGDPNDCPRGRRRGMGRGMGGDGEMTRGRMLAQGDLRLIALALIEAQPRHGYDIIKVLEEKTAGLYAPSPGVVYPTLTFLEDVGYLTSQPEGAKKLYVITAEGSAHLAENRAIADAVLDRLTAFGERAVLMRQRGNDEAESARPNCRRCCARRCSICTTSQPSGWRTIPTPKPNWSRSSPAPRATCARRERQFVQRFRVHSSSRACRGGELPCLTGGRRIQRRATSCR